MGTNIQEGVLKTKSKIEKFIKKQLNTTKSGLYLEMSLNIMSFSLSIVLFMIFRVKIISTLKTFHL